MKYYMKKYLPIVVLILLAGCGISRQAAELQNSAETAMENEDYAAAMEYYDDLIELKKGRNKEIGGETWYRAGITAWELDQTSKAMNYLEQAERNDYTTEESFYILSQVYREIDNLSLEINSLESYITNYPDGEYINEMRKRLFVIYVEMDRNDSAMELWNQLEDFSKEDAGLLEGYLVLMDNLEKEQEARATAQQLLKTDSDNIQALEYLGEYYFWNAENRYQEEMKAYEANKTTRQYRQLLDALDEINAQFRISRDYFSRLWNIDPTPQYATYLRNIYLRFGDEEKAEYFDKRAGN